MRSPFPMATPTTAPSTTITTKTSMLASSSVPSMMRTAADFCTACRSESPAASASRMTAVSSTSSTPPTITTPATVTWFAYNTGVTANGVRHRISPELVYFYHSLGFAAQYYHQDQKLQASSAKPHRGRAHRRLLRYGDLSPHGRAAARIQPADRTASSLRSSLRRLLRRGLGNSCSASTGWRSASRLSRCRADSPATRAATGNRSSNEAL